MSLKELKIVRQMGWLDNAFDVVKSEPAVKFEKLPNVSVEEGVAIAVKPLEAAPREKAMPDGKRYLFLDVELMEPAVIYDKSKAEDDREFEAPAGTKCTMNLARHSALERTIKRQYLEKNIDLTTLGGIVIANLGKRSFKTKAGKMASGYDYRIDTVANVKAAIEKSKKKSK